MAVNLSRYNNSYRCNLCKFQSKQCLSCKSIDRNTKYNDDEIYSINNYEDLIKIPQNARLIFFNTMPNEISWKDLIILPHSVEVLDLGFNNLIRVGVNKNYFSINKSIWSMNKYIQVLYDVFFNLPRLKLIILPNKYSLITYEHINDVCKIMKKKIYVEEIY
jgi:hypothetical protein